MRYRYTFAGESSTTLSVSNTQTINLAAGGAFIVQDSAGGNVAVIDSAGTMNIEGVLTENVEVPTADANDFVVQNSTGGLFLVGALTESVLFS